MDITPSNLQGMFTNFATIYEQGYTMPTPWWQKLAQMIPSTSELNTYGWMDRIPKLRKWIGPRQIQNAAARSRSVTNVTFELTESVPKEKIEDDQYGVFTPLAKQMGFQAAKWPDQQLATMIEANPVGFDNVAFFASTHPVNIDDASLGTQSNLLTAHTFNTTNYADARAKFQRFKGADGMPFGTRPTLLVVPPELEDLARNILNADFVAPSAFAAGQTQVGATANTLKGSADLLVIPELTDATAWYLIDASTPIMPFIFQLRQAPNFVYRNAPTDENVFWRREFIFGVDARGAFDVSLWFLAMKCTP